MAGTTQRYVPGNLLIAQTQAVPKPLTGHAASFRDKMLWSSATVQQT